MHRLEIEVSNTPKVIVPADVSYDDIILWAVRMKRESEAVVEVCELVKAQPLDAAHAFSKVAERMFGWVGQDKGASISVEVQPGRFVQVPWGAFSLPGVDGNLSCDKGVDSGLPVFVMTGQVKKRDLPKVGKFAQAIRDFLTTDSIYRGKAIVFEGTGDEGIEMGAGFPFFALNGKRKEDLLLPRAIARKVNATVFAPIECPERLRARGLPPKLSVVIAGKPGTGKSLALNIAAHLAVQQGMTYILLRSVENLRQAIQIVNYYGYGPCVIAAEDIDRVTSERDEEANALLNAIDGVDSKNLDVRFLFTTNDQSKIIDTFRRSGRTDETIVLPVPDAETAAKLMKQYADGYFVVSDDEYLRIGELLSQAETLPANIAEVCQRAKRYSVAEGSDIVDAQLLLDIAEALVIEKQSNNPGDAVKSISVAEMANMVKAVHDRFIN